MCLRPLAHTITLFLSTKSRQGHPVERGEGTRWTVRNLLLVPHFAFPPSAIVKRPPLSATAQRAGWVGCNFDLDRIPVDARIPIVTTIKPSVKSETECVMITPPEQVREVFRRAKTLKDVPERGWVLDVLNIVRRITSQSGVLGEPCPTFTNEDVYAYERELSQLHPGNRHIKDKIRQQLQVLRDAGFLVQPERGVWHTRVAGEVIGAMRRQSR